jgi:hypothetical protein
LPSSVGMGVGCAARNDGGWRAPWSSGGKRGMVMRLDQLIAGVFVMGVPVWV